jgi:hypothetical protein
MRKKIGLTIIVSALFPIIAFAANACSNATTSGTLGPCISQVYIWSMGAAGILALLMIVVGGYITLTAAGNAERSSRGKSYIFSSLLGLALLFGAFLLLNTINPDLTNFNLDSINQLNTTPTSSTTTTPPGK